VRHVTAEAFDIQSLGPTGKVTIREALISSTSHSQPFRSNIKNQSVFANHIQCFWNPHDGSSQSGKGTDWL